jgi:serine/threonine protein kinase
MQIEDWPKVRMLFEEALTVEPSRRSQWLAGRASEELLTEVATLLAADAVRESPLDRPESALGLDAFLELESLDAAHASGEMIGPFEVLGLLGEGRSGVVYRVRQVQPPREAALKLLRSSVRRSPAVRRFETEVLALARMSHPGIARVYEVGELNEPGGVTRPYLVMELVEGARPITALAAEAGAEAKLRLLEALCSAVAHAHQRGVLHRDLKPGNVLVDAQGAVKVIDFGIARVGEDGPRATMTGQLLGTPAYMSPEQAAGREADTRSDVHAIGLIAGELLRGGGRAANDLAVVLAKATARAPEARYQSVGELGDEFRRLREGAPILARPPSFSSWVRSWVRRNRTAAFASAAVLIAAGAAVASLAVSARRIAAANEDAREAVAFLMDNVLASLEDRIGSSADRRRLAQELLVRIERLDGGTGEGRVSPTRARLLGILGDGAQEERRLHEALDHLQGALLERQRCAEAAPQDRGLQADLSIATVRVGDVLGDLGRQAEQRERYERAMEIDRRLAAQAPGDVRLASNLGYSCERLAALAVRRGDSAGALRLAREQMAITAALLERDPDNPSRMWDAISASGTYDEALHAAGERGEFEESNQKMLAMLERLAKLEPKSKRVGIRQISVRHRRCSDLMMIDPGNALSETWRAERIGREMERADPTDWEPRAWVLRVLLARIQLHLSAGRANRAGEAVEVTQVALAELENVQSSGREVASLRRDSAHGVAAALHATGRHAEADAFVRRVVASMREAAAGSAGSRAVEPDEVWAAEERDLILDALLVLRTPTPEEQAAGQVLLAEMSAREDPAALLRAAGLMLRTGDRAGASRAADRALRLCQPEQTIFAAQAGEIKKLCEGG